MAMGWLQRQQLTIEVPLTTGVRLYTLPSNTDVEGQIVTGLRVAGPTEVSDSLRGNTAISEANLRRAFINLKGTNNEFNIENAPLNGFNIPLNEGWENTIDHLALLLSQSKLEFSSNATIATGEAVFLTFAYLRPCNWQEYTRHIAAGESEVKTAMQNKANGVGAYY